MAKRDEPRCGHLVIIGGHEDQEGNKSVLAHFVELAGGPRCKIVVVTAASGMPDKMWEMYEEVFADLDVNNLEHVHVETREQANDPAIVARLKSASGIFLTGGDQRRLLSILGGTDIDKAIHEAYAGGACIAGTSAGASAMSGHMLAAGIAEEEAEKGGVKMGAGLGLLHRVIIDQHFSARGRLQRLLTVIAQNPYLMGVGIDEDTALVIERGTGLEVIGNGTVTLLDCRDMVSNVADVGEDECPEILDVRMHMLPCGARHCLTGDEEKDKQLARPIAEFLNIVTKRNAEP